MTVQEKIRELMNERGWSAYKLSKESGLSKSTVSNLFRRNNTPTFSTLEAISKAFGVSLAFFISELEGTNLLTDDQQILLTKWNKLTNDQKQALLSLMDTM